MEHDKANEKVRAGENAKPEIPERIWCCHSQFNISTLSHFTREKKNDCRTNVLPTCSNGALFPRTHSFEFVCSSTVLWNEKKNETQKKTKQYKIKIKPIILSLKSVISKIAGATFSLLALFRIASAKFRYEEFNENYGFAVALLLLRRRQLTHKSARPHKPGAWWEHNGACLISFWRVKINNLVLHLRECDAFRVFGFVHAVRLFWKICMLFWIVFFFQHNNCAPLHWRSMCWMYKIVLQLAYILAQV